MNEYQGTIAVPVRIVAPSLEIARKVLVKAAATVEVDVTQDAGFLGKCTVQGPAIEDSNDFTMHRAPKEPVPVLPLPVPDREVPVPEPETQEE